MQLSQVEAELTVSDQCYEHCGLGHQTCSDSIIFKIILNLFIPVFLGSLTDLSACRVILLYFESYKVRFLSKSGITSVSTISYCVYDI
jgi:hypothetical protein